MDTAIIAASSALAGIIVGGVVQAVRDDRQFRREKWWAQQERTRQRLEDIYSAVILHREAYHQVLMRAVLELTMGKEPPGDQVPIPWEKLSMLVGLYAPELEPWLQRIEREGPELGEAATRSVLSSDRTADSTKKSVMELHRRFSALADTYSGVLRSLQSASRELGREADERVGLKISAPPPAP
jgi:hypothetical protein